MSIKCISSICDTVAGATLEYNNTMNKVPEKKKDRKEIDISKITNCSDFAKLMRETLEKEFSTIHQRGYKETKPEIEYEFGRYMWWPYCKAELSKQMIGDSIYYYGTTLYLQWEEYETRDNVLRLRFDLNSIVSKFIPGPKWDGKTTRESVMNEMREKHYKRTKENVDYNRVFFV